MASVFVPAGTVSITSADITDLRLDEVFCGLMRDGVTGIPTEQLQNQASQLLTQLKQAISDAGGAITTAEIDAITADDGDA